MDPIERWKLADELTVYQIALLIAGYDPSDFEGDSPHRWEQEVQKEVSPYLNALRNAARTGKLTFTETYYEHPDGGKSLSWEDSMINIDSLCDWMNLRNFQDGFFVTVGATTNNTNIIADAAGEFYAPKLAAAVQAWAEVTADPQLRVGKSPKKALEVWLRKHANEYGLTGKDGNPNQLGIEEVSKVANWQPTGGAPSTPVSSNIEAGPENAPQASPGMGGRVRSNPPTWVRKQRPKDAIPF
jgi:hypothetical protein